MLKCELSIVMFSVFSSSKEKTPKHDQLDEEKKNIAFQRVKDLLSQPDIPEDHQEGEEDSDPNAADAEIEPVTNSMIWRYLRAYSYDPSVAAPNIRYQDVGILSLST